MVYFSEAELEAMPFKHLGKNVKISNKCALYNISNISIGDNSRIEDFCLLKGPLNIGKYVHIAPFCLVSATISEINIDDFSTFAYRVSVMSSTDDYSGQSMVNSLIPSYFKNVFHGKVTIGRQVIIGTGSVILPDSGIGEGCAIGALSFINLDTHLSPWGIYAGIPVRRIKDRDRNVIKLEKEFLKSVANLEIIK